MSIVHQGHTASPMEAPIRQRALLRRLVIQCPETGGRADTGFELTAIPSLSGRRQLLVDCPECGQDHQWQVEDSFLD